MFNFYIIAHFFTYVKLSVNIKKELYKKANKTEKEIIELIKRKKEMYFYLATSKDLKDEKI